MIGRIRRNVQADLLILGKDRIVQGTFVLIIIWIFFGMKRALYYAKGIQHAGKPEAQVHRSHPSVTVKDQAQQGKYINGINKTVDIPSEKPCRRNADRAHG